MNSINILCTQCNNNRSCIQSVGTVSVNVISCISFYSSASPVNCCFLAARNYTRRRSSQFLSLCSVLVVTRRWLGYRLLLYTKRERERSDRERDQIERERSDREREIR